VVIVDASLIVPERLLFFAVADDSVHCSDSTLGDNNNQEIIASTFTRSISHAVFTWWGYVEV
jgi:hypothetical protein